LILIQGQIVILEDGSSVYPSQVLLSPIRGRRIGIMGDSFDSSSLCDLMRELQAKGYLFTPDHVSVDCCTLDFPPQLDVLVHEATLEDAMREEALSKGHSTPTMATKLAASLRVKLLILTHFSQRYQPIDHPNPPDSDSDDSKPSAKKRDKKDRPSVQLLLDEAKSNDEFKGLVLLADDHAIIPIPLIYNEEIE
ncbi:unnamed protein product, partial [Protopolystoma xenopodis]